MFQKQIKLWTFFYMDFSKTGGRALFLEQTRRGRRRRSIARIPSLLLYTPGCDAYNWSNLMNY